MGQKNNIIKNKPPIENQTTQRRATENTQSDGGFLAEGFLEAPAPSPSSN